MYPVMLDMQGRPCLVVGGGGVAVRKIAGANHFFDLAYEFELADEVIAVVESVTHG